jgi:hypothetical protein
MQQNLLVLLLAVLLCSAAAFQPKIVRDIARSTSLNQGIRTVDTRLFGARNRAWAKGDLSDKDIFEGTDDEEGAVDKKKNKFKLDPETVFFEGPPSASELFIPALSILTVIGIIPFVSALSRQAWVRYKFTSRRVSIQSGIGGKDQTEIIYPDIDEIRFAFRAFGEAGDMVLFLKDGAKVELRHIPNFKEIYQYVLSKCDEECQKKSMKISS